MRKGIFAKASDCLGPSATFACSIMKLVLGIGTIISGHYIVGGRFHGNILFALQPL